MNEVEKYIQTFEPEIKDRLYKLRQLFFEVSANTEERIRYKMPAYKIGKHYLYFAAYKKHIGFYLVYKLLDLEVHLKEFRA